MAELISYRDRNVVMSLCKAGHFITVKRHKVMNFLYQVEAPSVAGTGLSDQVYHGFREHPGRTPGTSKKLFCQTSQLKLLETACVYR